MQINPFGVSSSSLAVSTPATVESTKQASSQTQTREAVKAGGRGEAQSSDQQANRDLPRGSLIDISV